MEGAEVFSSLISKTNKLYLTVLDKKRHKEGYTVRDNATGKILCTSQIESLFGNKEVVILFN